MTDIVVPTLGESVTEATVAVWMKKAGDQVAKDEPVVELETDKVNLEVPAPEAGVLSEIVAGEGATVEIGSILGTLTAGATNGASPSAAPGNGAAQPAPVAAPAGGGATVDVTVPQMGESVAEGSIGSWLKKVGDAVGVDDPLVEVETDKAAVEIPSPVAGVLTEIVANSGDTVNVGSIIARIQAGATVAAQPAAPVAADVVTAEPVADSHAMPSARRVMAEGELTATEVDGTGRGGRITKGDALRALEARASSNAPAAPAATAVSAERALGAKEERVPMTRLRRTIARRLKEAQNNAAMLSTFNDVDMTAVIEARNKYKDLFMKKHGIKLGFMSFFVKAVIQALKDVPAINAEIDGDDIIYKNYYDIGVAVGTDRGLVVPVVRDADHMSLGEIEMNISDLGQRAREGRLGMDDMTGASFTITNGGVYGSLLSTPILNAPQSGILGMHRIEERAVVVDGQVVARPMMYLAVTYDHRIVDGKEAVTFLVRVKECVEDPERLLLDL